jgi:hypothetical protein
MASILKVDTLTGVSTAGSISVTGEGNSTTTNMQSGLAKCYMRFNPELNVTISSFNVSSRSDDGTGLATISFTNSMGNDDYLGHEQSGDTGAPQSAATGAYCTAVYAETTGSVGVGYGYSGNSSGTTWAFYDFRNQKFTLHGDLA